MISRYTRPAMGAIWELENKFNIWKEISCSHARPRPSWGSAASPRKTQSGFATMRTSPSIAFPRGRAVTNHDVIAFLTNMAEYIDADIPEGEEKPSRWVHSWHDPSSDLGRHRAVVPNYPGKSTLFLADVSSSGETCKRRAFEFQNTLCVGRTHGIGAEATVFGMKFGSWAWALKRAETPPAAEAREVEAARRHFWCSGHLFEHRPVRRTVRLRENGPDSRSAVYAGACPRSPRAGYVRACCNARLYA